MLGGGGIVAAVRDAEDREVECEQLGRELTVALPLADVPRGHDREVPVDVDVVRRDDDRGVDVRGVEAAAELLHRAAQPRIEAEVAVRRDAGEDDHGSAAIRSTSISRNRCASTSTPTWAFRVALEVCQRSTTVRPSQKRDDVSISTLQWTVVSSVGSMTCATAIASWMGEPSKP